MAENKNAKTPTDDGQPVAWLKTWSDGSVSVLKTKSHAFADHELEPLYAAPQKHDYVIDCPRCGHCCQLLETEQKPVAWMHTTGTGHVYFRKKPQDKVYSPQPVYTAPPKREWVGLTDEEINSVRYQRDWTADWTDTTFARAIEAKLREKNGGEYRNRTTTERIKLKEKNQ